MPLLLAGASLAFAAFFFSVAPVFGGLLASFCAVEAFAFSLSFLFLSAAAAGIATKSGAEIKEAELAEAVRNEIAEFGLTADLVERNVAAALESYRRAPAVDLARETVTPEPIEPSLQAVPYLGSAAFAGPTIRHRGSAALRATGNWRTERPEIDLAKCKRCFLCYLYCPEAAMRLDGENFPHVDYDHCKGCMICYEECPTEAISRRLEA